MKMKASIVAPHTVGAVTVTFTGVPPGTYTSYTEAGMVFTSFEPEAAAVVPEPATILLVASGLAGLVARAGSRHRKPRPIS